MSTESSTQTPVTTPELAAASMQSSMAAGLATRPDVAVQSAAASAGAESHACCHTASAASPVAGIGLQHAAESESAAHAAAHSCAEHKTGDGLPSLLKEFESADTARRVAAVVGMGKLADCAAAAPLIVALGDRDADVAREAATALGVLGDASAVEPLIAVLQNADGYFHPVVRAAATFSLGQLHDLRAFEPLVQAIHDPVTEASAEAIRSLAALADPRAVDVLLAVIRNINGFFLPAARRAAILGLDKLGGTIAECELRFVSTNQWEDAVIREAAVEAINMRSPAISAH